jgi:Kae1-associated kinase Bud32
MAQILAQGAEAVLTKEEDKVIKDRISKGYRLKQLDEQLRKKRTKSEAKILEKAKQAKVNVPELISQDNFKLEIEFIGGDKLSDKLNSYEEKKQMQTMQLLGKQVAKLHENNLIHGDLTTSNTILKENKVFIIDFGLSFHSSRLEDKAVDLHLIKQALEAKHFQNYEKLFKAFLKGYKHTESSKVLEQLKKVEARGRYKH